MQVNALFGNSVERTADQLVDADFFVDNLADERRIRTVFQQAAHQIGQQGFVRADRRVNAHAAAQVLRPDHLVVQRFAHAVQTLVFEILAFAHLVNRRQRVGVVGGELREHGVLRGKQFARAGKVGNVGVHFAGVDRIAVQAVHLRPFDFAVPIRAFDQAYHQFLIVAAGKVNQVVDDERATFLVCLHHETDAVVTGQIGVGHQRLHQIQRQLQAVGFFGVDIDADIVFFAQQIQLFQARQQFAHDASVLGAGIARVDGGKFDGNAVAFVHALPRGIFADGVDGLHIIVVVAVGIGLGVGGFAQHIERITVAHFFAFLAVLQGFFDGLSGYELLAQEAHGVVHAFAYQRLAAFTQQPVQRRTQTLLAGLGGQFAGNQQPPRGGVDKQRRAVVKVFFPVAV